MKKHLISLSLYCLLRFRLINSSFGLSFKKKSTRICCINILLWPKILHFLAVLVCVTHWIWPHNYIGLIPCFLKQYISLHILLLEQFLICVSGLNQTRSPLPRFYVFLVFLTKINIGILASIVLKCHLVAEISLIRLFVILKDLTSIRTVNTLTIFLSVYCWLNLHHFFPLSFY